jgi:hypothetical protein
MPARFFLTYKLNEHGAADPTRDWKELDTTDQDYFDRMRGAVIRPERAFRTVNENENSKFILDQILERASGFFEKLDLTIRPTGTLRLHAAALVMAGTTKELVSLVAHFPNKVKLVFAPPHDNLQVGYARVRRESSDKKPETVVIVAPQVSWWSVGEKGQRDRTDYFKKGWEELFGPTSKPGQGFRFEDLAPWLLQADTRKAQLMVKDEFWPEKSKKEKKSLFR